MSLFQESRVYEAGHMLTLPILIFDLSIWGCWDSSQAAFDSSPIYNSNILDTYSAETIAEHLLRQPHFCFDNFRSPRRIRKIDK